MERDQLLDVLAGAVRETIVMVMDAQVGGALRVKLQHLPEPALDGAVEPRVRIGWCVHALLGCDRSGRAGRTAGDSRKLGSQAARQEA